MLGTRVGVDAVISLMLATARPVLGQPTPDAMASDAGSAGVVEATESSAAGATAAAGRLAYETIVTGSRVPRKDPWPEPKLVTGRG
jgi:hypothetical protein